MLIFRSYKLSNPKSQIIMTTFYKVFLVLFIVFIAVNLYAVDWQLGILHQENNKFLFSIVAAILGVLVTLVMNKIGRASCRERV